MPCSPEHANLMLDRSIIILHLNRKNNKLFQTKLAWSNKPGYSFTHGLAQFVLLCVNRKLCHTRSRLLPADLTPSFHWWSRLENASNALHYCPHFGSQLINLCASFKGTYLVCLIACRVLHTCLHYKAKKQHITPPF